MVHILQGKLWRWRGCIGAFTSCGGDSTSINIADAGTGYIRVYTNAKLMRFTLNNSLNDLKSSKLMRFKLNNSFNDVNISRNVSCVVETCNIPKDYKYVYYEKSHQQR
jgi:hypothetical protein